MTTLKRILLLLVLGACLVAAGCGGDDEGAPIPADQAAQLERRVGETEDRLANGSVGACEDILNDTMPEVGNILDTLPNDVDPEVRDALEQSFENLWSLVERRCEEAAADQPDEPAPAPETETTTTETEPEPEPTETVPPPTETVPPAEDEELPEEGDGDNDGAIPGDGNGGGVGPGGSKAKKKPKEKP